VLHARQEKRDRIDQCAVQIEKNCVWARFNHTGKVNDPGTTS
jgi:hypothetical protein